MSTPVHAIRALRWNYRWSGVWCWLKAKHNAPDKKMAERRGIWWVLRQPSKVVALQDMLASGAFS